MKKRNIFILSLIIFQSALIFYSFSQKNSLQPLETNELIIRGENGATIRLGFSENVPEIAFFSNKKEKELVVRGGQNPTVESFSDGKSCYSLQRTQEGSKITLFDNLGNEGISLVGMKRSGVFIKNSQNRVVGTLTVLEDNGGGFGLANNDGYAASILRGGVSPGISFYGANPDPLASFGLIEKTPHFVVLGPTGDEGLLIHGGMPTGLMLLDEKGVLKVLISKHGVFKHNEVQKEDAPKEKKKYFTFEEDLKTLFPDCKKPIR